MSSGNMPAPECAECGAPDFCACDDPELIEAQKMVRNFMNTLNVLNIESWDEEDDWARAADLLYICVLSDKNRHDIK